MPSISAVSLPDHLDDHLLPERIAVVIDVLRATTTIAHALDNAAACIIPVASIDAARLIAKQRHGALLCGERGGIRPDGFTLGNSPAEYSRETVGTMELVLSTTNGTRALQMCDNAHEVLTASITNLNAVASYLRSQDHDVTLVCSGTDRSVSLEDCICAGLLAARLQSTHAADDSAMLMRHAAEGAIERCGGLAAAIASSFHANRLVELGFGTDVSFAAMPDTSPALPCFDPAVGEIRCIAQNTQARG